MSSLPYVDAIYKEVLRWRPVAPISVPHSLVKEDMFNGDCLVQNAMTCNIYSAYLPPWKTTLLRKELWWFKIHSEPVHIHLSSQLPRFEGNNNTVVLSPEMKHCTRIPSVSCRNDLWRKIRQWTPGFMYLASGEGACSYIRYFLTPTYHSLYSFTRICPGMAYGENIVLTTMLTILATVNILNAIDSNNKVVPVDPCTTGKFIECVLIAID